MLYFLSLQLRTWVMNKSMISFHSLINNMRAPDKFSQRTLKDIDTLHNSYTCLFEDLKPTRQRERMLKTLIPYNIPRLDYSEIWNKPKEQEHPIISEK